MNGEGQMSMKERLAAYEALLDRKEALATQTTENNKAIEKARADLAACMIDEEFDRLTSKGYSYILTEKTCYSKRGGTDDALFETLREDGLGDIIKETVNPRTLQAAMKDLAERNDGELPEQYRSMISEYSFWDVLRRKTN